MEAELRPTLTDLTLVRVDRPLDPSRVRRGGPRLLARDSGFALAVVVTLGLGVGVATGVFSLMDAVVLRPLDYDRPDALVQLYETGKREGGEPGGHTPSSACDAGVVRPSRGAARVDPLVVLRDE